MSRLNIKTSRKRVSKDRNAGIPRGVVLLWKIDNNTKQQLINEHFDERDLGLINGDERDQATRPNLNG